MVWVCCWGEWVGGCCITGAVHLATGHGTQRCWARWTQSTVATMYLIAGLPAFIKVCPEPTPRPTSLMVGVSRQVNLWAWNTVTRLLSKCLCSPASPRWPYVFAGGQGRKLVPATSLIFGEGSPEHSKISVKRTNTHLPPV